MSMPEKQLEKRVKAILHKGVQENKRSGDQNMNLLGSALMGGEIESWLKPMVCKIVKDTFCKAKGSGFVGGCCNCGGARVGGEFVGGRGDIAKLRSGGEKYREFMKKLKDSGMSHKEALAQWRMHKNDTQQGGLEDALTELGLPPPSDPNDEKLADYFEEKLAKTDRRKGRKPSAEQMEKLASGRHQYQVFMKTLKEEHGLSHKDALAIYREMKAKKGGNWFDDFKKGFMLPFEAVSKLAPLAPLLL